jgi:hypothetical protein
MNIKADEGCNFEKNAFEKYVCSNLDYTVFTLFFNLSAW